MSTTKPIPVRLPVATLKRLDAAAKRIGNTRAGLMRFLIETWLDDFERRGMTILPEDYHARLAAQDNRTLAARNDPTEREQRPHSPRYPEHSPSAAALNEPRPPAAKRKPSPGPAQR